MCLQAGALCNRKAVILTSALQKVKGKERPGSRIVMTCDKTPSICGLKVVRAAWQEKCHQDGCSKGGERAGQTVL